MADDLVERLLRKEQVFPARGGGAIRLRSGSAEASCYITDDGKRLVNPDGPEASDEITRLRAELASLRGAVQGEGFQAAWDSVGSLPPCDFSEAEVSALFAAIRAQAKERE